VHRSVRSLSLSRRIPILSIKDGKWKEEMPLKEIYGTVTCAMMKLSEKSDK